MSLDPRDDLKRLEPYLGDFRAAAEEEGVSLSVLCAVCLRESIAGWALQPKGTHLGFGDQGHGWGLFQCDLRTWEPALRGLIPDVDLMTPLGQARLAAKHLASSRRLLRSVFPMQSDHLILQASIASYNARIGAVVMQIIVGRDVDAVTTPGPSGHPDYSADVLRRSVSLENRAPTIFPSEKEGSA